MINRNRFRCILRLLEKEYGEVYTSKNKSLFLPYINRLLYQCEILNDTDYEAVTLYFLEMLALSNQKFQNIDALSLIQKTY